MQNVIILIQEIWLSAKEVWHSNYRWLMMLMLLWIFRVTAIPADSAGLAKGLQVGSIILLLFFVTKYYRNALFFGWKEGNAAIKWMMAYLAFGLLSTLWSYVPQFSFFLSFEKIVLISVIFFFFYLFDDFALLERAMLLSLTGFLLFEAICWRIHAGMTLFTHSLSNGTCAAVLLTYCIGEWLAGKGQDEERQRLLKSITFVAFIILIVSTSGGANTSAVFGIGLAFLFSGNFILASLMLLMVLFLYIERDWMDYLLLFLMPGKTEKSIETATGRTKIWEFIILFTAQKQWCGWGYAAIERLISDRLITLTDAHNNWYGAYGGTGIVGLSLLIIHQLFQLIEGIRKRMIIGYTGLLCALSTATLNGYSFGYLSGKTCDITLFYFAMMVATVRFNQVVNADEQINE